MPSITLLHAKLDPENTIVFGSGSVCCSGALRAPELLENSKPAVRDRGYKNQTDSLPSFLGPAANSYEKCHSEDTERLYGGRRDRDPTFSPPHPDLKSRSSGRAFCS